MPAGSCSPVRTRPPGRTAGLSGGRGRIAAGRAACQRAARVLRDATALRVTRRPPRGSDGSYGPCGPAWTRASRPSTTSRGPAAPPNSERRAGPEPSARGRGRKQRGRRVSRRLAPGCAVSLCRRSVDVLTANRGSFFKWPQGSLFWLPFPSRSTPHSSSASTDGASIGRPVSNSSSNASSNSLRVFTVLSFSLAGGGSVAVVPFSAAALITGRTAGVGASRAPRPRGCRRGTGGGRGRSRPRGGRRRSSRLPSTRSTELSPAPEARRGGRPRQLPVGHGRGRRRPGSAARGARRGSRAKSRPAAERPAGCWVPDEAAARVREPPPRGRAPAPNHGLWDGRGGPR